MPRNKVNPPSQELLSRKQAEDLVGCSEWQLRKMQRDGVLKPVQVQGAYFFHRDDLQRFARSKLHGAIHAECFTRFEAGQSPERVVIELQLPLEEVERIHLGWLRMADAVAFRPPEGVSRKRWEQAYGIEVNARTIRRALELVAVIPAMRRELVAMSGHPKAKDALSDGVNDE
jgi:hypothetical protein